MHFCHFLQKRYGPTDGPLDGHSFSYRCEDASKKHHFQQLKSSHIFWPESEHLKQATQWKININDNKDNHSAKALSLICPKKQKNSHQANPPTGEFQFPAQERTLCLIMVA